MNVMLQKKDSGYRKKIFTYATNERMQLVDIVFFFSANGGFCRCLAAMISEDGHSNQSKHGTRCVQLTMLSGPISNNVAITLLFAAASITTYCN